MITPEEFYETTWKHLLSERDPQTRRMALAHLMCGEEVIHFYPLGAPPKLQRSAHLEVDEHFGFLWDFVSKQPSELHRHSALAMLMRDADALRYFAAFAPVVRTASTTSNPYARIVEAAGWGSSLMSGIRGGLGHLDHLFRPLHSLPTWLKRRQIDKELESQGFTLQDVRNYLRTLSLSPQDTVFDDTNKIHNPAFMQLQYLTDRQDEARLVDALRDNFVVRNQGGQMKITPLKGPSETNEALADVAGPLGSNALFGKNVNMGKAVLNKWLKTYGVDLKQFPITGVSELRPDAAGNLLPVPSSLTADDLARITYSNPQVPIKDANGATVRVERQYTVTDPAEFNQSLATANSRIMELTKRNMQAQRAWGSIKKWSTATLLGIGVLGTQGANPSYNDGKQGGTRPDLGALQQNYGTTGTDAGDLMRQTLQTQPVTAPASPAAPNPGNGLGGVGNGSQIGPGSLGTGVNPTTPTDPMFSPPSTYMRRNNTANGREVTAQAAPTASMREQAGRLLAQAPPEPQQLIKDIQALVMKNGGPLNPKAGMAAIQYAQQMLARAEEFEKLLKATGVRY